MQNTVGQGQIPQPQQGVQQHTQPVYQSSPQHYIQQPQTVAVPNHSGVNIQIFNPSVGVPGGAPIYNVNAPSYPTAATAAYPSGYYTNNWGGPPNTQDVTQTYENSKNTSDTINKTPVEKKENTERKSSGTKTEKREIVELTDDYIRNLENYLNSQDTEIRLMGANEVVERIQEDSSRKDDKALTALINKMLQDPSVQIRVLALSMLDSRNVTGDDLTVELLKNMQNSTSGYGQDALQAASILLKMSGQKVEKEFEVKNDNNTKKEISRSDVRSIVRKELEEKEKTNSPQDNESKK